ncbi:MAG: oxidoreductase [Candidatus Magasanikbacteria bacterium GW2011_GWC2_37_14]|uniref:Oxidoreductase n=1 Tax=Candidatus Magasanikbacteria bacterium GW2011_GWC2_37_14 TaxID=1619046 RepID=A0A0G0GA08_9BACT|nr:MAG: oxidoreductase [Candidatus Magasanikbacteria bacterium GW2011_GWC2_37_14]
MFRRFLLYLLLLANLVIIFYFWSLNSGAMLLDGGTQMYLSLGRITGLLAVFFILLQLILIGRVKWVEQVFGLDKLSLFHHWVGVFIPVLVLAHPIFLVFGYQGNNSFFAQTWQFITQWELLPAYGATLLFVLVTATSIYIVFSKKLKYEWWFLIHLSVYVAILWAFEHQLEIGGDFFGAPLFVAYWWLIYFFAFGNLILFRFLRPLFYFYQHQFKVDKVVEECPGVWSIYFTGKNLNKFIFQPGQFAIWRFLDRKNCWQAHPFSFSAVPNGSYLRITYKNLGDYTAELKNVKPGTFVLLDGPSGIFTAKRTKNNKILLIAGGVGISSIRCLLEDLQNQNRDVVLLFGSRKQGEIIFEKELVGLSNTSTSVCSILSDDNNWVGEKGRIDEEKIKRLVPDYLIRDIYVCGPPMMMKGVVQTLFKMGVKKSKIYFEKFSLGS